MMPFYLFTILVAIVLVGVIYVAYKVIMSERAVRKSLHIIKSASDTVPIIFKQPDFSK